MKTTVPSLYLREEELRRGAELLFFASRTMAGALRPALESHGLGHAHFRALYFISRRPNLSVGALIDILGITKQSLNRVLKTLMDEDLVTQRPGVEDRRQRLLSLSEKGAELAKQLEEAQLAQMAAAYRAAGPHAVAGFWEVLERLAKK